MSPAGKRKPESVPVDVASSGMPDSSLLFCTETVIREAVTVNNALGGKAVPFEFCHHRRRGESVPRKPSLEAGKDVPQMSRSVVRAIDILDLMMERQEPIGVADVIAALNIPKSTAYELIRTLVDRRYVERKSDGRSYFLGPKLFELGMAYSAQVDLVREAAPIVRDLRDRTHETVQLSVLDNDQMLVMLKEESSHPIRIISRVGSRVPVNWAAAGRLLVSDFEDDDLKALLKRTLRGSPTGQATMDIDKVIADVRRFRKQGYSFELNEANEHAGCVAAPVIDGLGHCVAALSIVAPEHRLAKSKRGELVQAVREAAIELSQRIGGQVG
jgi:DNA-binding IclR family transcriptional regulator